MQPIAMPENQVDSFGNKLKIAREYLNLNQEELGEVLDIRQHVISNYENGHNIPFKKTQDSIKNILFTKFSINLEWWGDSNLPIILKVQSQKMGDMEQGQLLSNQVKANTKNIQRVGVEKYVDLPYVSLPARAGFVEIGDGITGDIYDTFPVRYEAGEDYKDQIVFEIDGDSMEPIYVSGTKVRAKRVPTSRWPYITSGVYGIAVGGSFLIKRIKNNDFQSGFLVLHSDNEATGGSLTVRTQDIRSVWKVLRIVDSPAR